MTFFAPEFARDEPRPVPRTSSEPRHSGRRDGASGGDPEDEALDPELIHDLGCGLRVDESKMETR